MNIYIVKIHFMDKSTGPSVYDTSWDILTHGMKIPVHSFCADVKARGGLELCSS